VEVEYFLSGVFAVVLPDGEVLGVEVLADEVGDVFDGLGDFGQEAGGYVEYVYVVLFGNDEYVAVVELELVHEGEGGVVFVDDACFGFSGYDIAENAGHWLVTPFGFVASKVLFEARILKWNSCFNRPSGTYLREAPDPRRGFLDAYETKSLTHKPQAVLVVSE